MGNGIFPKWCYKCCGKKDFERLAKAHHLNEREISKFTADYKEIKKAYKKMNDQSNKSGFLGLVVLPNF